METNLEEGKLKNSNPLNSVKKGSCVASNKCGGVGHIYIYK